MKKLLIIFSLFLFTQFCFAQNTAVTATITSPDGTVFSNSNVTMQFIGLNGGIDCSKYLSSGTAFSCTATAITNGSGVLSVTLPDDQLIVPAGGKWNFSVCSNASSPCWNSLQDVHGTTINLTSSLSADAVNPSGPPTAINRFYADTEVSVNPQGGNLYYNLTTNKLRIYTAGAWADVGSGGSTPVVGTNAFTVSPPTPGRNNIPGAVGWTFHLTADIIVSALGRYYGAGNTLDHTITLWSPSVYSAGTAVKIAEATVFAASPSDSLGFKWATLGAPVTILAAPAGGFTIASGESTDLWNDSYDPSLQTIFIKNGSAYGVAAPDSYPSNGGVGNAYGSASLQYTLK